MKIARFTVACQECKHDNQVDVNLWTGEAVPVKAVQTSTWHDKKRIVESYKKLKGFDRFPSWNKIHGPRAFGAAKKLLHFFSILKDPVEIALECLEETASKSKKEGWDFTLETVVKRADEWLVQKGRDK